MEARLFPHGERGGFENKEDLRNWLDTGLRRINGTYALARRFAVPSNSLALFMMEGSIVGCAVVREAVHEMTKDELALRDKHDLEDDWRYAMCLDPDTIWVWRREQEVKLRETGIRFLPGPPMTLTAQHVWSIFRLVAQRSGHRPG